MSEMGVQVLQHGYKRILAKFRLRMLHMQESDKRSVSGRMIIRCTGGRPPQDEGEGMGERGEGEKDRQGERGRERRGGGGKEGEREREKGRERGGGRRERER